VFILPKVFLLQRVLRGQ